MTIDKYSLNARIYPMILLFMPLVVIGVTYSIEFEAYLQILSTLGVLAALVYFMSNLGRDLGKKGEQELWNKWGGMPTAQLLSFENDQIDGITKKEYHKRLNELSPIDTKPDFENAEFSTLLVIYRFWTKFLISKTRDTKKYSLLFKENISYGFRRNTWGLRGLGISICLICLLGNLAYNIYDAGSFNFKSFSTSFLVSEVIIFIWLLIWIIVIKSNWVRIPAFAYGERLLEAIRTI